MLKERLRADLVEAMRRQDKIAVSVLRMLRSAIHNAEIAKRVQDVGLDDTGAVEVLSAEAKRRQEAIEAYGRGGRDDLVAQERAELKLITSYLPESLTEDEIASLIDEAIAASAATSLKDLGKVMAALKPKIVGRADGAKVAGLVRTRLQAH
ncbi:GatB/YqeY domain-containing protein [Candidatus Parcubacteria bacterium]|nr:GatB/YqeY domain-containing protein [Candidatus Parcubacteria bacterium]